MTIIERKPTKDEEDSRRKQQLGRIIDGKETGERCIISRILGGLRTRRSQGNPKSSNIS